MKNKLPIIIGAALIAILLILGITYLMSLRKVSFALSSDVDSAVVYTSKKQKVREITSSSSVLLTKGTYYAVPAGKNISDKPINFTVKEKDTTIVIDPAFADAYLKEQLKIERPSIVSAITSKYPSLIDSFTLTHETLYKRGDWLGGLLEPKVSDIRQQKDPYRIVLHKKDKEWQVVRRPEYILTSSRYEEVPIDVLRAVNSIVK